MFKPIISVLVLLSSTASSLHGVVVIQRDYYYQPPSTVYVVNEPSFGSMMASAIGGFIGGGIATLIQNKIEKNRRVAQYKIEQEHLAAQERIERMREIEEINQLKSIGIDSSMAGVIQKLPTNQRWQAIADCLNASKTPIAVPVLATVVIILLMFLLKFLKHF